MLGGSRHIFGAASPMSRISKSRACASILPSLLSLKPYTTRCREKGRDQLINKALPLPSTAKDSVKLTFCMQTTKIVLSMGKRKLYKSIITLCRQLQLSLAKYLPAFEATGV